MKNKIIVAILALISVSCSVQTNNNEVKPTSSSTPTPIETSTSVEVKKKVDYCKAQKTAKLDCPTEIAVSKDGSLSYIVNYETFPSTISDGLEICKKETMTEYSYTPPSEKSIYKLNKNKLEEIEFDNKINTDLNCSARKKSIKLDNEDNLYFMTLSEIYKLSKDNSLQTIHKNISNCNDDKCNFDSMLERILFDSNKNEIYALNSVFTFFPESHSYVLYKFNSLFERTLLQVSSLGSLDRVLIDFYKDSFYMFARDTRLIKIPFGKEKLNFNDEISNKNLLVSKFNSFKTEGDLIDKKMLKKVIFLEDAITNIKINSKGEIYFNDLLRSCIWKLVPEKDKVVDPQIFVGGKAIGYKDGKGNETEFKYPTGMDFDGDDNLYVTDSGNNAIRKITPDGIVSTIYKEAS